MPRSRRRGVAKLLQKRLSRSQRERLRRRYRPAQVRTMFVGESPPASGRFFYRGDSGLYRAMREAFQTINPSVGDESFLAHFQSSGCYFVDLCAEPVDRLDTESRRAECRAGEASLSRTIARLHPAMIVTVVRSSEGNVFNAAASADWNGRLMHLPYPGRWSHLKRDFVRALAPAIAGMAGAIDCGRA